MSKRKLQRMRSKSVGEVVLLFEKDLKIAQGDGAEQFTLPQVCECIEKGTVIEHDSQRHFSKCFSRYVSVLTGKSRSTSTLQRLITSAIKRPESRRASVDRVRFANVTTEIDVHNAITLLPPIEDEQKKKGA